MVRQRFERFMHGSTGMRLTRNYLGMRARPRGVLMTGKHPDMPTFEITQVKPESARFREATSVNTSRGRDITELLANGAWGRPGPGDPNHQGFDFFGYNCQRHAHSYYPNYLWKNHSHS